MKFIKPEELENKGFYKTDDGRMAKVLGNVIVLYKIKEENGEKVYHSPMHTLRSITDLKFSK